METSDEKDGAKMTVSFGIKKVWLILNFLFE